MSLFAYVESAPVGQAPASVSFHKRVTVTDTAGTLGSFISGGIPAITPVSGGSAPIKPQSVMLGVEVGSAANTVYITWDGQTTPSATAGFIVPTLPNFLHIPVPDGLILNNIKLLASANPTYLQAFFAFGS